MILYVCNSIASLVCLDVVLLKKITLIVLYDYLIIYITIVSSSSTR